MYVKTFSPWFRKRGTLGAILAMVVGAGLLLLAGCEQPLTSGSNAQSKEAVEQQSANQSAENDSDTEDANTSLRAWFLPPLAPEPELEGEVATGLDPVVVVRDIDAEPDEDTVASFTTGGEGSERVRLGTDEERGEYYIVNFHLRRAEKLEIGMRLSIEVLIDEEVVGSVNAEVVATGADGRNVEDAVPLVAARTVPIKFALRQLEENETRDADL